MRRAVLLLLLGAAASLPLPAPAATSFTVSLPATADLGLPFWCDWGYDWEERCYRDDGPRLPVGGADSKVWRSALRFPISRLPGTAEILDARLQLHHDGTCIAPRLGERPCGELGYVLDVHRVLSKSWTSEREVDFDPRVLDAAVVVAGWTPQRLSWNVTGLARAWHEKLARNDGLLVKLQDGDEDYGYGGPYLASTSHPSAEARPRLVVTYTTPG